MKLHNKFLLPAILIFMLACNMPLLAKPAATEAPVPLENTSSPFSTGTSAPVIFTDIPAPTLTFTPAFTATVTATTTPLVPQVVGATGAVNCRFGPGLGYEPIGVLDAGVVAQIIGKSADGDWWQVRHPVLNDPCWVSTSVVNASGNLSGIGVVGAPQALVTGVNLKITPTTVTVPGCVFPGPHVDMKGTITTNGPVKVTWHWETSEGEVTGDAKIKFDAFGSQSVEDNHSSGAAGTHWIKLVVTFPNFMQVTTNYKTQC